MNAPDLPPLSALVVSRFDINGLETGVVDLINGLPERECRQTVIALAESDDFRDRIRRADVTLHVLGRHSNKSPVAYLGGDLMSVSRPQRVGQAAIPLFLERCWAGNHSR